MSMSTAPSSGHQDATNFLEVAVAEQVVQRPTVRRVHLSGVVLAQVALEDGDLLRHAGLGGAPEERGGEGVRVRRVRGAAAWKQGGVQPGGTGLQPGCKGVHQDAGGSTKMVNDFWKAVYTS